MDSDEIYRKPLEQIVDFRFDEQVARVFPDMLRRSVPGYGTLIALTGVIAAAYARPGTAVYDLGCSLGACTLSMRHRLATTDCRIIAVDNSPAMVARCRALVAGDDGQVPVEVVEADLGALNFQPASLVVLNLTLQFIPPAERTALLSRICAALVPGGALLLTEKVRAEETPFAALHEDFKRANGYSELEISQKRAALENVLIAESEAQHRARLQESGFGEVHSWFRCLQFVSLLAIR